MGDSDELKSEIKDGRGRSAEWPSHIPLRGWRDIAWRVWAQLGKDNLSVVAGGVAFYSILAIFPAIAAAIFFYGLVADPHDVPQHLSIVQTWFPKQAWGILQDQLESVAASRTKALGWGVVVSIAFALWSSTMGVQAMMSALNIAYDETEKRSFIVFYAVAFAFSIGGILMTLVIVALIVVLSALMGTGTLPPFIGTLFDIGRWPVLAIIMVFGLSLGYRWGPSRRGAKWRWLSWGAVIATALWLGLSWGFSAYVASFGNYNETYGSLAAVAILMMWFYLTAYVILLGAEINAEIEHQTAKDSTVGPDKPMGERGAYVADTIGREQ